jgi:hypothetical protein
MPPQNRETPRERYKSDPLTEEERHDLPIRRAEAIASGPVIEIESGLNLQMQLFGASIMESGDIHASVRVTGYVTRPGVRATATGVVVPLVIPAKLTSEDTS